MAEFLTDPSVLTKDKLKSALVANNVSLPNGEQKKGVYVELYLKKLTSQNKTNTEVFSSDEEPPAARSGRKATRKTDRVRPEEIDVTELTDEDLKDRLQKYGVNAGPIVASTRKVYEKKLQKLLDLGPPQTTVITSSEQIQTNNSRNGNTDSDQYSDKEEETTAAEPEPEPEPVPMVETTLRSRGKTPVTTRTRSTHQKEEDEESEEDDVLLNVERRSRRSCRRLDHSVPDPVSETEMLPVLRERKRISAIPKDPKPLIADTLPMFPSVSEDGSFESPDFRTASLRAAAERYHGDASTDKFCKRLHVSVKTAEPHQPPSPTWQQGKKIEKLSAVEQTPKTSERNVLKDLFPNEVLNTPTGISATRRQPIKGAAGRPFSDPWQDSLRPRLTEHRYTTSSYTESRSAPRVSAAPLSVPPSVPKSTAPPIVPAKARRRVPVWVQLLLLAAVAGFLLFVYQAMESNQMNPFVQPSLENSGK
ncbi:thymopoietin a isoform X3 [Tachysurus fulvidraco]|uniref:thymopoietin a isoform X3 n=1 Tax=Tachysurus fulvidraco TaxID=1234273 RepID=UPI000F517032|nr:thymopoietin a isoform X3 [Tachysurus fulvidraco]